MGNENTIIEHLSQTLNATRRELQDLVRTPDARAFDALMAEVIQGCSQLRVREAGTYSEWYYLASTTPSPRTRCGVKTEDFLLERKRDLSA